MKSNARRKIFINNTTTYGMAVAAYIIMQALMGAKHIPSPMKGLLAPFHTHVIMTVSLNLTVDVLGELSLGRAGFIYMRVFAGASSSKYMKGAVDPTLGMIIAILVGAVTAALFGAVVGIPVLRFRGDYLAIVALAFGEIIRSLVNTIYLGRDAASFRTSFKDPMSLEMGEGGEVLIKGAQGITGTPRAVTFTIDIVLVLVTLFIIMNPVNSRTGRAIMAIRDNRITAESIDINIIKYKLLALSISAGSAGAAGVLYAHNLTTLATLSGNFGYSIPITILIYVILDGIGDIYSSVIATVILYFLPEMPHGLNNYRILMCVIVPILAMLLNSMPQFVVLRERVAEKFSRRDKRPVKEAA